MMSERSMTCLGYQTELTPIPKIIAMLYLILYINKTVKRNTITSRTNTDSEIGYVFIGITATSKISLCHKHS